MLNGVEYSSMWLNIWVSNKYISKHPVYTTALNYTLLQLSQSVNVCNHCRQPPSQCCSGCPPIITVTGRAGIKFHLGWN